jgi:hypothetical protein
MPASDIISPERQTETTKWELFKKERFYLLEGRSRYPVHLTNLPEGIESRGLRSSEMKKATSGQPNDKWIWKRFVEALQGWQRGLWLFPLYSKMYTGTRVVRCSSSIPDSMNSPIAAFVTICFPWHFAWQISRIWDSWQSLHASNEFSVFYWRSPYRFKKSNFPAPSMNDHALTDL